MSMIDYIHLNPVRRGLVAKASDGRWSSAAWIEGNPTCDLIPDRIPRSGCLQIEAFRRTRLVLGTFCPSHAVLCPSLSGIGWLWRSAATPQESL